MKKLLTASLITLVLACNNQVASGIESENYAANKKDEQEAAGGNDYCSNNLWFRKGAQVHTSSYDETGIVTAKQISTVTKVSTQGNMTVSDLEMKNTDRNGGNEKTVNASYKCDGKLFYIDLTGFLSTAGQENKIESSGLQYPFDVSVGDALPDADYNIVMTSGGTTRKIKSYIKERRVESKEMVTTPAGTFDCFKISAVIETDMNYPGMDETSKKVMEEVKKKMGKTRMICWYAPALTIIKMELHMGDKLKSRSEVTAIKK